MKTTSPAQLVALGMQDLGRTDERRDVQVVAARVHLARVGRDVVDVEQLLDRQRIHVATQQHDLARAPCRRAARR